MSTDTPRFMGRSDLRQRDPDELDKAHIKAVYAPKSELLSGYITRVWYSEAAGRLVSINTGSVVRSFKPSDLDCVEITRYDGEQDRPVATDGGDQK